MSISDLGSSPPPPSGNGNKKPTDNSSQGLACMNADCWGPFCCFVIGLLGIVLGSLCLGLPSGLSSGNLTPSNSTNRTGCLSSAVGDGTNLHTTSSADSRITPCLGAGSYGFALGGALMILGARHLFTRTSMSRLFASIRRLFPARRFVFPLRYRPSHVLYAEEAHEAAVAVSAGIEAPSSTLLERASMRVRRSVPDIFALLMSLFAFLYGAVAFFAGLACCMTAERHCLDANSSCTVISVMDDVMGLALLVLGVFLSIFMAISSTSSPSLSANDRSNGNGPKDEKVLMKETSL